MNRNRKNLRLRIVSIISIALMVIGLFSPGVTLARSLPDKVSAEKAHIQSDLLEAFKESDTVRYLVLLKEQTDSEKVALKAAQSADNSLSSTDLKTIQQKAVVSSLQKTAAKSQIKIAKFLQTQKTKGHISNYQSYYIVNGFMVTGDKESMVELSKYPEVESISLDKQVVLEPDGDNSQKVAVTNTTSDESVEWHLERIGAPEAWAKGITGEGVVIANIDSGVRAEHPALKQKYRGYNPEDPTTLNHEFNWYDAANNIGSPVDSDGHGTHTMGTMVGQTSDGSEKIGVAPGAKWIAARAFAGESGYESDILEAAQWVLAPTDSNGVPHPEMAPDIVNNSWGGNPINNDWFRPVVKAWRSAGIVPIFSIGNAGLFTGAEPGSASAPGNYPESIGVGATDEEDNLASFSLRGPTETGLLKPDISAPGVNIRSSFIGETWNDYVYDSLNGTSMAAPQVAATVALMLQADPSLSVNQIDQILKQSATPKTNEEYQEVPNNGFGYGLLNTARAVEIVSDGFGTLQGQIVITGEDGEAPTYLHDERESIFIGEDAHFAIHAMDNISVDEVTLTVTYDNGTVKDYNTSLSFGNHLDGTYELFLPNGDVTGGSLEYYFTIKDFYGNETETERYQVEILEGITAGYFENFESYPDGWFSFGVNNSWQWGVPEFGPDSGVSGEKVMGTNLRGNYAMSSNMSLVMPPVLVEEGTQLRFNQWYSLSWFGWDKGTVYASTDMQNWEPLYQVIEDNENWHEVGIPLSKYAGQKIYIAFNLTSLDNEHPGWYIDDVQIVNNNPQGTSEGEEIAATTEKSQEVILPQENKAYPAKKIDRNVDLNAGTLPVEASVTVVETGWETTANIRDGSFTIYHPPGEYTLEIEAYGYEPYTTTVTIEADSTVSPTYQLTALPKQKISGEITDQLGNPISGATLVLLAEEGNVEVKSEVDGTYQFGSITGTYILKVFAPGYESATETVEITNEAIQLDVELATFLPSENTEIYYDNGNYSKNYAFGKAGSGFAVRMSLAEGEDSAMLQGAKLQFWAGHVPVPGGTDILISVYDATEDGKPGKKLAGPVLATAERNLYSWTDVDLSHLGIEVDGDFFILYQQADDYPYVPGFVSDGDRNNSAARSWDYFGGEWYQADQSVGNYMIRAVVDYGEEPPVVDTPVITSPEEGFLSNEETITVEGTGSAGTEIHLFQNGEDVATVTVDETGEFTVPVELIEGVNKLKAISLYKGRVLAQSTAVNVTLDTLAPELAISSPVDGFVTNKETVTLEGTVVEENLEVLTVNGEEIEVVKGAFSKRLILNPGKNIIDVTATDVAGNTVAESVLVTAQYEAPVITEVQPGEDQYVLPGDEVKVFVNSNAIGGSANFKVIVPGMNKLTSETSIAMEDVGNGDFEGTWTVPINLVLNGALIEVEVIDAAGNSTTETAPGKLFVSSEQVNRVFGDTRYDTALEISQEGWANGEANTVVLARGQEFADALAGAPLAYQLHAPILLTPSNQVWDGILEEINRLGAENVVILGGKGAISTDIVAELEAADLNVRRIAGANRFETAALIAAEVANVNGVDDSGATEAIVANGMDYPDALSVASYAAKAGIPILLTRQDNLPKATVDALEELNVSKTIVVGGEAVVSTGVATVLPDAERISGSDRYNTNIALANYFGLDTKHIYIATGKNYADALSGAVLAAKNNSGILLVHRIVPEGVVNYLSESNITRLTVYGGVGAVSQDVEERLVKLIE